MLYTQQFPTVSYPSLLAIYTTIPDRQLSQPTFYIDNNFRPLAIPAYFLYTQQFKTVSYLSLLAIYITIPDRQLSQPTCYIHNNSRPSAIPAYLLYTQLFPTVSYPSILAIYTTIQDRQLPQPTCYLLLRCSFNNYSFPFFSGKVKQPLLPPPPPPPLSACPIPFLSSFPERSKPSKTLF